MRSLYKERVEGGRGENSFVPWQETGGNFPRPTCTDCEAWVAGDRGLSLNLDLCSICWPSIGWWCSHCRTHRCCTGSWVALSLVSGTACKQRQRARAQALVAAGTKEVNGGKRLPRTALCPPSSLPLVSSRAALIQVVTGTQREGPERCFQQRILPAPQQPETTVAIRPRTNTWTHERALIRA